MDAELKSKWVAALRSGDFKQGEGMLHNPKEDSYCCLGVLCKVMGAEWKSVSGTVPDEDEEDGHRYYSYDHVPVLDDRLLSSNDDEELSNAFASEIGIEDQRQLVTLNDGRGKPGEPNYKESQPFSVIADYIEKNL